VITESDHAEPSLFDVTDGKAVGTYIEHKFKAYLAEKYEVAFSSSASGIDLPKLEIDIKVTSITQPLGLSKIRFSVYKKTPRPLKYCHLFYFCKSV
jgi:hypothetical protein